jgi:hypothetical protein
MTGLNIGHRLAHIRRSLTVIEGDLKRTIGMRRG